MLQSLYTSAVIDQMIHDRAAAAARARHAPSRRRRLFRRGRDVAPHSSRRPAPPPPPEPPPPPVPSRPRCSPPPPPPRPAPRRREPVSELPGWNAAEPTSIMDVVLRRVSSATFVGRADELALLDGAL